MDSTVKMIAHAVAQLWNQGVEKCGGCRNQADRGGQACEDNNQREDGLTWSSHSQVRGICEQGRARFIGLTIWNSLRHVTQAEVDTCEQNAGDDSGQNGRTHQRAATAEAFSAQGSNDHDAESQAGDGVMVL